MSPGVRKLALTAHVASSVGWLGAVVAFLAFAIVLAVYKPRGMTQYGWRKHHE